MPRRVSPATPVEEFYAGNDEALNSLLHSNPFAGGPPPTHVRVSHYRYAFAPVDSGSVWTRELVRVLVRPADAATLESALKQ